jgi:hypothetical protein
LKNKLVLTAIIAFSLITTVFTITAYADTPAIPQWIKNNAKWWSEGTIPDSDFLKGMQYLIQQGIIQVPISVPVAQVTATNGNPSDNDRVMSLVVHFKNIANVPSVTQDFTINSFQRIYEFGQTTTGYSNVNTPTTVSTAPKFQLYDLPSKDKAQFYQLVNVAIGQSNVGSGSKATFDILIDLFTGDGTLLHTLDYTKCNIDTYFLLTNGDKNDYRMASEDQAEHREATNFICQGYHLDFPSKK